MFSRPLMLSFCLAATAETPRPVHATLPVRRSTCTTIIALRSLRHATANDQGLGEGLGFPMWSAGETSGEDGAPSRLQFADMVDGGPRHGSPTRRMYCTYSPAVLKSLCVAVRKCWVPSHHPSISFTSTFGLLGRLGCTFVSIALTLPCPS